jgi:hypothetical protein
MRDIEIMLSDGMIGNKAIALALSALTTGNLNSKLRKGAQPFTIKTVLPSLHGYLIPPLSPEEEVVQASKALLSFMAQAPGAPTTFTERLA